MIAAASIGTAHAKCGAGTKTLFSCPTKNGKQIELCDAGKTVEYSFGRMQAKPEIIVSVARAQASTSQWAGIGRWMSYAVDIPNGKTVYNVFWGVDRLSDNHDTEAGVNVMVDGKPIATVECTGKNIVQNMEGVDLKQSE